MAKRKTATKKPTTPKSALDAIHDEAVKLMKLKLSAKAEEHVGRIISISRYNLGIRTKKEQQE